ncbi:hypothetical protein B0J14DRAFT_464187, partial [Halenospora varia]
SANLLNLSTLVRIPLIAILHYRWCRRYWDVYAWRCLAIVIFGLILFRFPIEGSLKGWFIAFVAGNSISGFAAVSTLDKEMLIKRGSFWEAQIWMYCWRDIVLGVSWLVGLRVYVSPSLVWKLEKADHTENVGMVVLSVFTAAAADISAMTILGKKDNLMLLIGTTGDVLTSSLILCYL